MFKSYVATQDDLLTIEEALKYVWHPKLDFIFRDKAPIRTTVIASFDSQFIYIWTQKKLSGLSSISCRLKNYFAYKIPHQLSVPIELQYAWHAGVPPEVETLLSSAILF